MSELVSGTSVSGSRCRRKGPAHARRTDPRDEDRGRAQVLVPPLRDERHRGPGPARRPRRPEAEPATHPRRDERPRPRARAPSRGSARRSPATRRATTTRTARASSTRRSSAWRSRSTCARRSSTGQGNFGNVDGDPPAAMRYTEAKMTAAAIDLLADLEKETVDFTSQLRRDPHRADGAPGALPEPDRQRRVGHRGGDGVVDPAAQPRRGLRRDRRRSSGSRRSRSPS